MDAIASWWDAYRTDIAILMRSAPQRAAVYTGAQHICRFQSRTCSAAGRAPDRHTARRYGPDLFIPTTALQQWK